jgi:diaminopropionate ammonia-lyase
MAGLNCGTVSFLAWPILKSAVAVGDALTVDDSEAAAVMRELEKEGMRVGACGAATVVGARKRTGWKEGDVVVLISSEGRVKDILGL